MLEKGIDIYLFYAGVEHQHTSQAPVTGSARQLQMHTPSMSTLSCLALGRQLPQNLAKKLPLGMIRAMPAQSWLLSQLQMQLLTWR